MSSLPQKLSCLFVVCGLSLFCLTPATAGNISVSPSYQYLNVTSSATESALQRFTGFTSFANPHTVSVNQANITYSNHSDSTANFDLSLAHIQATDLYGRLQFNAPLPQSIIPASSGLATISPQSFTLNPGETATVSVTFNPLKIEPGKTAYLVMAETSAATPNQQRLNLKSILGSSIVIKDPITAIPKLVLSKFNFLRLPLSFTLPDFLTLSLKNTGSGPTMPRGLIQINDSFGQELMRGPLNDTSVTILPGSERLIYARLQPTKFTPLAFCTLKLNGSDFDQQSHFAATKHFLYIHPLTLIGLLLITLLFKLFSRRRLKSSLAVIILLAFPASPNYRLNEWSIGGGGDQGQSENYESQITQDSTAGDPVSSSTYRLLPGLISTELANVPPAPTITNPASWYSKLHLVVNTGNNPIDTKYLIAVSTDNFATSAYVKADSYLGATATASDWRTYASWGGATGADILGLEPNTLYYFRVKAEQGDFTESGWGPSATGTTADLELSFDLDVAATDQETAPPYSVNLGELAAGSVTTATDKIWIDFATNAYAGGVVYVTGTNGGLKSDATNHTIAAISADLSGQTEGYGLKTASITQTLGGPFTADSPFNGSGDTVGSTGTVLIPLNTSLAPLTGGRSSHDIKSIISNITPGATDYTETLTLVAAGMF